MNLIMRKWHREDAPSFLKRINLKNLLEQLITRSIANIRYFQLFADLCLLTISLFLCALILKDKDFALSKNFLSIVLSLNILWGVFTYSRSIYKEILIQDSEVIIRATFKMWFLYVLLVGFIYNLLMDNLSAQSSFSLLIAYSMLLFGIFLLMGRVVFLSLRKVHKGKLKKRTNIIIIGSNTYSSLLQKYITQGYGRLNVVASYNTDSTLLGNANFKGKVFEAINNNKRDRSNIDEVFCCISSFEKSDMQELIQIADKNMIRIKFLPDFYSLFERSTSIDFLGKIPIVRVREEPLLRDKGILIKRIFDILFSSLVILLLLSWLIPILILIIKLDSPGPAFFKQKRSGKNNQSFNCYKFRSMVVNKNADITQTSKNDKRITRIGAILRKTSLDELPQFFNVFIGNMSIVGPRPHMISHTKEFGSSVNSYMVRHFVKPGITGWAQINGFRGETKSLDAMEKRVEHDVWYLENWTFLLDIKIIFLTVWNIFKGEENAF